MLVLLRGRDGFHQVVEGRTRDERLQDGVDVAVVAAVGEAARLQQQWLVVQLAVYQELCRQTHTHCSRHRWREYFDTMLAKRFGLNDYLTSHNTQLKKKLRKLHDF